MQKEDDSCKVYDETLKSKSKNNHLPSLTYNEFEKKTTNKHTIENPFFNIDSLFTDYVTNHNKKFDVYFIECDFEIVFDNEFEPPIEADSKIILTILRVKTYFLGWIEHFNERECEFSHCYEMKLINISDKKDMTFEF